VPRLYTIVFILALASIVVAHALDVTGLVHYPRLQILTVAELLEGRGIDRPFPSERDITIKRAPRATRAKQKTGQLPLEE